MKKRGKILISLIAVIVLIIISRSIIYKSVIKYEIVGKRDAFEITDEGLIDEINQTELSPETSLNEIAKIAGKLTSKKLKFTTKKVESNPNTIVIDGKANCVGYSALFNALCNELIKKHQLRDKYSSEHLIGKLNLLNFDLHQLFKNPFFKDHDFNVLINIETGDKIYVDPTIQDYIGINQVNIKN